MPFSISTSNLQLITSIGAVCMALFVILVRMRAQNKPTNVRKILIPPLGMSTGFLMFVVPQTHLPWLYVLVAFLVGVVFSYPLVQMSKMEVRDGAIYMKRSRAFPLILLGLLALRMGLHSYVEEFISLPQTGAAFFILAFGMILPWRLAMYARFQKVSRQLPSRA